MCNNSSRTIFWPLQDFIPLTGMAPSSRQGESLVFWLSYWGRMATRRDKKALLKYFRLASHSPYRLGSSGHIVPDSESHSVTLSPCMPRDDRQATGVPSPVITSLCQEDVSHLTHATKCKVRPDERRNGQESIPSPRHNRRPGVSGSATSRPAHGASTRFVAIPVFLLIFSGIQPFGGYILKCLPNCSRPWSVLPLPRLSAYPPLPPMQATTQTVDYMLIMRICCFAPLSGQLASWLPTYTRSSPMTLQKQPVQPCPIPQKLFH